MKKTVPDKAIKNILTKYTIASFVFVLILFSGLFYYSHANFQLLVRNQEESKRLMQLQLDVLQAAEDELNSNLKLYQENSDRIIKELQSDLEKITKESKESLKGLSGQLNLLEQQSQQKIGALEKQILNIDVKSESFSAIIDKSIKSVVSITTELSMGSGAIVDKGGYIITNRHVIEGATSGFVKTNDGTKHQVRIVAKSPNLDLAIVKIEGIFPALNFGGQPELGNRVIALGSPAGLEFTVTEGIVSATRTIGNVDYVQTDLSLNPGNSGGPLLNSKGEIVGINTRKITGYEGLGFAISSEEAKRFSVDVIRADKQANAVSP